jgi:hypothetical protein
VLPFRKCNLENFHPARDDFTLRGKKSQNWLFGIGDLAKSYPADFNFNFMQGPTDTYFLI